MATPLVAFAPGPHPDVVIPLSNGGYTLVDQADLYRIEGFSWFRKDDTRTSYAARYDRFDGKRRLVFMHRDLYGLTPDDPREVDHRNHNGLDNRRSFNLRLATRAQNSLNNKKRSGVASRYKGVTPDRASGRWVARIGTKANGSYKTIGLGYYDIEEEAAFAFGVAAPLLKDPDFLCLVPIPDESMPDMARRSEIREGVIGKVKAILSGGKGKLDASSRFHGVCFKKGIDRWEAVLKHGKKTFYLGRYASEVEAAVASHLGATIVGVKRFPADRIDESANPSTDRREAIGAEVRARIEAVRSGRKGKLDARSPYLGVCPASRRDSWRASIKHSGQNILLGEYQYEVEAAFAFNCAASTLSGDARKANAIDPARFPSLARQGAIRDAVESKLAAYLAGHRGKLDRTSRYSGVSIDTEYPDRWIAQVSYAGKRVKVGRFETEASAALAFNLAVASLRMERCRMNSIPASDLPGPSEVEAVEARVASRTSRLLSDRRSEPERA